MQNPSLLIKKWNLYSRKYGGNDDVIKRLSLKCSAGASIETTRDIVKKYGRVKKSYKKANVQGKKFTRFWEKYTE